MNKIKLPNGSELTLKELYNDYIENFYNFNQFRVYYKLTVQDARYIIQKGKKYYA